MASLDISLLGDEMRQPCSATQCPWAKGQREEHTEVMFFMGCLDVLFVLNTCARLLCF
jgi:hypothetical protein